ncbi:MAG: GNAT family N-acetyltransferase, partial [Candidatus Thorarchaeota archaeon]
EIEELVQFNAEIFGAPYGSMFRRFVDNMPGFESKMNPYIRHLDSGRIASSITAFPCTWSYDDLELRNLEMCFVGTLEPHRKKGLFSILYGHIDRLLKEDAYDITSVQGVPYLYRKFGYDLIIPSWNTINLPVDAIQAITLETYPKMSDIIVRSTEENDLPSMMTLLDETNRKLLVSTVRSKDLWLRQERLRMYETNGFESKVLVIDGAVDGYFRLMERISSQGEKQIRLLIIRESCIRSYESVMRALYYLKELANEKDASVVAISGDLWSNLAAAAHDLGGRHDLIWKHQIRIPDFTHFLNRIRPVLEKRLKGTMFEHLTKEIFINTYRNCFRLSFVDGALQPIEDIGMQPPNAYPDVRLLPDSFMRLIFGEFSVDDLHRQNLDCIVTRGNRLLMDTLFPVRKSFLFHYHC